MNLGIFGGRLGRDAELHTVPASGESVLNFSVAVDIGTRDNPKTQWVECAIFGKRAQSLERWLTKGVKVTVSGRVSLDTFKGRDGVERTSLKMSVNEIDMHLPPKDGQAPAQRPAASPAGAPAGHDQDDDLPF